EQDVIGVRTSQDSQYIEVYCGDDTICYISKEVRSKWSVGTFKIRIVRDEDVIEQEIDKNFFKSQNYTQRVVVSCPVDVEIIDSDGNVACIVTDKVQSIYYGDFGVATCYEIGVGEYEKTIDLSEDYSVRIIGKNDGVMDVSVYSFEDEKLMTPYSANDIDVTNQMVATIKSENNGYSLLVDLNSDGDVDEVVELILSPQDGVNGSDSDGDVISSGNLQNNDESVKWIWIALLGSILLLVCAVITFVTIKARRQRND
ncbi:MAG: hypothetical protein IKY44_02555, partial [Clostridia bacterium]|nr:hypothetical protein [Clostridia bacterium]